MNKKVLKRIVAAGICGVMMGTMLTGCKSNLSNETDTVIWYIKKPIDNMSSYDTVMKEANKIIGEQIGVNLEFKMIEYGSYDEKLNVLCASGDEFDLCYIPDTAKFQQYIKSGAFLPIDDLIQQYGQDILQKQDAITKDFSRYDGKLYAVDSCGAYSVAQSWVFRKDLVEKYNFDYKNVKSFDDLEPYLKLIKENEPEIIPLFHQTNEFVNQNIIYSSIEGIMFDEIEEKFKLLLDIPEEVEVLRKKNDFYQKGYIASDAISREGASERNSGKYAVFNNGGYYSADGSKSTAMFGFPCVETFTGNTVIAPKTSDRTAFGTTSKHPEKAMQLLNLIWKDDDLLNLLAYGVEGVNYTVNEERTAQLGEKSIDVQTGDKQTWAIWHNWLGNLWGQWDSEWNRKEALEQIKKTNENAKLSKTVGFSFDTEPVKAEVAKVSAAAEEIAPVLTAGCMEDFETYTTNARQKMIDAGAEKVLEEMNRQYSEWKSEKTNE